MFVLWSGQTFDNLQLCDHSFPEFVVKMWQTWFDVLALCSWVKWWVNWFEIVLRELHWTEFPSRKPIHIPLFLQTRPVNLETGVFVLCIAQLFFGIMMPSMATFVFNSCRAFYLQIFTTTCLSDLFQRADLFLRLHFCSQSSGISLVVFFIKPSFVAAMQRHSQTSPPCLQSSAHFSWSGAIFHPSVKSGKFYWWNRFCPSLSWIYWL